MRRPRKYNSDYMSRKMDERLEQVEDNLSALYANAAFDMNAKFSDFIKEHEKRDENYREKVESGEMSEEEYISWRNREIVRDTRFRSTIDSLSDMMVNTDIAAMALLEGEMPLVVAQSYNFVQSLGFKSAEEAGLSQGTFQIYNARSVQTIIDKNPDLLKPKVDVSEDKKWSMDKINKEITQSIVQGEAIPKVADRISRVAHMSESAAVRNARTAMTSAENLGRSEAAQDLKEKGIPIEEQWSATMDSRTRESHLLLDGTYKDENGYFGADFLNTPLRYPADPLGDPEEIYNCRCRLSIRLKGIDHSQDGELYEKFMQEKHPEDWKNIQENKGMQARKAEAEATRERQKTLKEELAAKQEEERQKAQAQPTVAEDKPPVIDAETAIASTEPTITAIPEEAVAMPEAVEKKIADFEKKNMSKKTEFSMVVDNQGNVIGQAGGKKTSTALTQAENEQSEGGWHIHNHPLGNVIYSDQDIKNYEKYGVKGGIVITQDGTEYQLICAEPSSKVKELDDLKHELSFGGMSMSEYEEAYAEAMPFSSAASEAFEEIEKEWREERRAELEMLYEQYGRSDRATVDRIYEEWKARVGDDNERKARWLEANAEKYGYVFKRRKV